MNSIWLEHPKYPGYRVSPEGNVLSFKRGTPFVLKSREKTSGYLQVVLDGDHRSVHRLVAEIYLDRSSSLHEVNHKNGIKTDNRIENLEWVTKSENMKHAHRTGLKGSDHRQGEKSNFARLSNEKIQEIRTALSASNRRGLQAELARKYNVTPGLITMIKQGKVWAHLKA